MAPKFTIPSNVTVACDDDAVVRWQITQLRNQNTDTRVFRMVLQDVSVSLLHGLCASLPSRKIRVTTPLGITTTGHVPAGRPIVAPVLRAGLKMEDGAISIIPRVALHQIGIRRIEPSGRERKFRWEIYYENNPRRPETVTRCFVVDPMIARGGTTCAALKRIKEWGIPADVITLVGVFAAPKGIRALHHQHPDIPVVVAVIDPKLDDRSYIVPGCGDAGDRANGTVWLD